MINQNIQILQFYDYFSLPKPTQYGERVYFKTDEEVYNALDKINSLPIKAITERIQIGEFYKGYPQDYQSWILVKDKGKLYLIPSNAGIYSLDLQTQIFIPEFSYVSMKYNDIFNGVEFVFTTKNECSSFEVIFKLDDYLRFVVDEIRPHEESEITLDILEEIYQLLHFDEYTWYEKSMFIHLQVLGEDCDLRKCSKDRPDKVSRWIGKFKKMEFEPIVDFGSEPCNCSEDIIEYWVHKKSVSLSMTIQFLLMSKNLSFTAKAIIMFIAFHSFNSSVDYNKTKACIRSYAKDLYNGTEYGLNELVKLGWLEVNEYEDFEACQLQCKNLGYHVCIDEYYSLSSDFTKLVGWNV